MSQKSINELLQSQCKSGRPLLSDKEREAYLGLLHKDWKLKKGDRKISRQIGFKNYYETIAFVNTVAWVAHQEDHHPDLKVSYSQCKISLSTHDADGITKNDFICAAQIDQLLA